MMTRRWASIFVLVVLAMPCALGAPKRKADAIIPNLPAPLEYPDEQPYFVKGGTINLSLTLNGVVTVPSTDRTATVTVNATAQDTITLTASGGTRQYSFTGSMTTVSTDKWGKTSTMKVTGKSHGSKAIPEVRPGQGPIGPIAVSTQLKSATAAIYRAWSGTEWRIPDIEGEMVFDNLPPQKLGGGCSVRVPCFGGGGSSFSGKVNALEASGGDDLILVAGGIVESAWQNGGLHGSFSLPVLAACNVPGSYIVNTVPVMRRLMAQSPGGAKMILIPGTISASWELGNAPPTFEMVMEPFQAGTYDTWLPVPKFARSASDMPLLVKVELKSQQKDTPAPRARMDFYLKEVSRHRGECGNYPRDQEEKDDLRFSEKQPEGIIVDSSDPKHAYTKDPEARAVVGIEAEDGGAHGHLEVRCNDLNLSAEYKRLGVFYLPIPKDDNANHIGDAWEQEKGILGENLPADWDEKDVAGQTRKGDGLTLYEDYRGFLLLRENGAAYVRLNPKRKALFVIDQGGIFDRAAWTHASGIDAYELTEDMVKGGGGETTSRIVDFLDEGGGHKYAVRLETVSGMIEKDPDPDFPADALKAFGYTVRGLSPKDATRCRVFPDRIRYKLQKIIDHIANGLKNPNSEDGQALTDSGISPGAARQALDSLQSSFGIIVKQVITVCAIHEMGHACSLKGHVELKNGELKETTHGDPKCPMRDMGDTTDNRRLMILQVLFGLDHVLPLSYDRFCSSDEYHCFQSLNVNDR